MKIATLAQLVRFFGFLKEQLENGPLEITWKPWRNRRSNEQNAYLWRAVYQPLVEAAGHSKDEWHEYFCGERFGWIEKEKLNGDVVRTPSRTTTKPKVMDKAEFGEFVQWVEAECARRGVFVEERWHE